MRLTSTAASPINLRVRNSSRNSRFFIRSERSSSSVFPAHGALPCFRFGTLICLGPLHELLFCVQRTPRFLFPVLPCCTPPKRQGWALQSERKSADGVRFEIPKDPSQFL